METVILTDEAGRPLGLADRLEAHTGRGQLHRAFSVYVFAPGRQDILIQRRSAGKLLWPLIWANTCCSHPRQGETALQAGTRRCQEEMGFACPLTEGPAFVYRAEDPGGRGVEHEHVTLLVGEARPDVVANPAEVAEWRWVCVAELRQEMAHAPDQFAPWFHRGLEILLGPYRSSK
jgi:isopentenyl-diphosphate delta-isomerase